MRQRAAIELGPLHKVSFAPVVSDQRDPGRTGAPDSVVLHDHYDTSAPTEAARVMRFVGARYLRN